MEKIKVKTVCGFGVGSSILMKIQVDEILKDYNLNADVEACDLMTISAVDCDLIFTSTHFFEEISNMCDKVIIPIDDVLNKDTVKSAVDNGLRQLKRLEEN